MIARAGESDIDALVTIHAESFDTGWTADVLRDFVEHDLVLVAGDPVEGFVIVRAILDEAEIITLAVAPSARHRGIGQHLVEAALTQLQQRDVARIFLEVASDNVGAIALYTKAGFKLMGRRKGYYTRKGGPPVDALTMSYALPSSPIVTSR
jgi:[ribosomal protein S18]-alanine N-acetyltransferase